MIIGLPKEIKKQERRVALLRQEIRREGFGERT
jgi:alanine dehydrogenase